MYNKIILKNPRTFTCKFALKIIHIIKLYFFFLFHKNIFAQKNLIFAKPLQIQIELKFFKTNAQRYPIKSALKTSILINKKNNKSVVST